MKLSTILFLSLLTVACGRSETVKTATPAASLTVAGDAAQGQKLVDQYNCTMCHIIPGAGGMQGTMGPSLAGVASRPTMSLGSVPTTPENVAQFIRNPTALNPQSSMPPVDMSAQNASHIAAYLMTLR